MPPFVLRVAYILMGIAVAVIVVYGIVWILGMLGFAVPVVIRNALLVLFCLAAFIYGAGGWMDPWFRRP